MCGEVTSYLMFPQQFTLGKLCMFLPAAHYSANVKSLSRPHVDLLGIFERIVVYA